jgi:glycosyltransferase involved in cell wall biosynthesis
MFGLVMIEAMACGTPVIAYDDGSVPEVLEEGRTGFIVKDLEDATEAIHRVASLSRARRRRIFEKRFTASRTASDYVKVYMRMIERSVCDGSRPIITARSRSRAGDTTRRRRQKAKTQG